ncbi:unnamed protein product [Pleuronectes platessa]|uniref:Uncharacterized protein n=1 Tax=Pleuronectes platessa TaxID=8262 RepID=A0A9N7YSD8_PLEPL|nr:unnamed protein product [Pleuronectes platessa]
MGRQRAAGEEQGNTKLGVRSEHVAGDRRGIRTPNMGSCREPHPNKLHIQTQDRIHPRPPFSEFPIHVTAGGSLARFPTFNKGSTTKAGERQAEGSAGNASVLSETPPNPGVPDLV